MAVLSFSCLSAAQALTPAEIKQPQLRALQEKYFQQLQSVGAEVQAHVFPYSFYFSRVLDLELSKQEHADQRSLRFDTYGGMTVFELTGNYFASYSSEMIDKSHRALRTFQDVMMPILEISMAVLKDNPDMEGFAMEISHHVRGKAMGMGMERPENLVLVLPKGAALRLVNGKTEKDRQAALLEGQFFVNGEPFLLYLSDRAAREFATTPTETPKPTPTDHQPAAAAPGSLSRIVQSDPAPVPSRDTSPESLAKVQESYQKMIDVVVKNLDSQAHFVPYAAPSMIGFRKQIFLEFSLTTNLTEGTGASRYKAAALAFDEHIAHLIRPMMAYFKGDLDFDGVAFSTTIHQETKTAQEKSAQTQGNEAVEFFLPVTSLRCYEAYDCTGQQLIDAGAVLVNGERVTLDLQVAESGLR